LVMASPYYSQGASWNQFDQMAKQQIGIKYQFGGNTPQRGFDCSGLVEYLYAKMGKKMPHGTTYLKTMGKPISIQKIKKGDLIFFKPEGQISHVGVYLGDGVMIHSPKSGKNVTVLEVFEHNYWSKKIAFVRRIVPDNFFTKA
jgi:cell wall-associated NlpC family hydrolase